MTCTIQKKCQERRRHNAKRVCHYLRLGKRLNITLRIQLAFSGVVSGRSSNSISCLSDRRQQADRQLTIMGFNYRMNHRHTVTYMHIDTLSCVHCVRQ